MIPFGYLFHLLFLCVFYEPVGTIWVSRYQSSKIQLPEFTEISYSTRFSCSLGTNFCLFGNFIEDESLMPDRHMMTLPLHCSSQQKEGDMDIRNRAIIRIRGGDGTHDTNKAYDPKLKLFHNCTNSGDTVLLTMWLPFVSIRTVKAKHLELFKDLTDRGESFTFTGLRSYSFVGLEGLDRFLAGKNMMSVHDQVSFYVDRNGNRLTDQGFN